MFVFIGTTVQHGQLHKHAQLRQLAELSICPI